jgi:DNA-binding CsgD family transcriptional regulator
MLTTGRPAGPAASTIAAVIQALGTERFEFETLRFLNSTSGVEHYTVYRVRGDKPEFISGASIRGPHAVGADRDGPRSRQRSYSDLRAASRALKRADGAVLVHDDLEDLDDVALRRALAHFRIVDRVVVCGRSYEDIYAVSLLRSVETGPFDDLELDRLNEAAEVLIAAIARHAAIHGDKPTAAAAFGSIEAIEAKLRHAQWRLTERELQVAARILYGVLTVGISLDLGLGEETIATYRKRLYHRLRIGSRHELFQKYLTLL